MLKGGGEEADVLKETGAAHERHQNHHADREAQRVEGVHIR